MNHSAPLVQDELREAAEALRTGNLALRGLGSVDPLEEATPEYIARTVAECGCSLAVLPDDSWATSVFHWQPGYRDVLVDQIAMEESRSDLVMQVRRIESNGGFLFKPLLVSVS